MDLFELAAKLTLDSSGYEQGMSKAQNSASSFGSKLKNGVTNAAKVGAKAIGLITGAAAAVTGVMTAAAKETAAYGDTIDKQSQKLGVSAEAYQKWDYVMNLAGTSMQNMGTGLKTLTNKIDDAKNGSEDAILMFDKLGISLDDLSGMTREEIFEASIAGFQGMADSTERAALANDLFGKSGQELTPLFNTTTEETAKLMDNLEKMGGIMSDDAVKNAAAFQDSLTNLQTAIGSMKRGIAGEFLPSIVMVMDGLTALFSGDKSGTAMINQGLKDMLTKLKETLPKMLDAGTELILNLLDALIENLPELVSMGMTLVIKLAVGIVQAIPKIIEKIPEIISAIGQAFEDNKDELKEAGITIITLIGDGLSSMWNKAKEWGGKIVANLAAGLTEKWDELKQKIINIAGSVKSFFGIEESSSSSGKFGGVTSFGTTEVKSGGNYSGNPLLPDRGDINIVLDDGTLVGAIAPKMNGALGDQYTQSARGSLSAGSSYSSARSGLATR